jgi:hypothetical protein
MMFALICSPTNSGQGLLFPTTSLLAFVYATDDSHSVSSEEKSQCHLDLHFFYDQGHGRIQQLIHLDQVFSLLVSSFCL